MSSKNEPNEGCAFSRSARRWSICRRLALLYAASGFVMLLLATVYLHRSLFGNLEREKNAFLANRVLECRRLLRVHPDDTRLLANEIQAEAAASQFIRYYMRLLDDTGRLLLETPGMSQLLPVVAFPIAIEAAETPERGLVTKSTTGESYLLMSAWAQANGSARRMLQVAIDVSADEALIATYRRELLLVLVLGMLFSCVSGMLVTRKGLRPLEEIAQATERVTASHLHGRIVPNGWPLELVSLARSFDQMLDRLQDSFTRLSQFSADLAHELRTPISNLRGEAGVALSRARTPEQYRRVLESSLEEYARLSRLIDNLLFLARADTPITSVNRTRFNARKAIETVREYYEALAEDRGVAVTCEGEALVEADLLLFQQAMSNLLSNGLNFTSRGGKVVIAVRQRDGQVEIVVNDNGCGIAPEHLPHIFNRLYRADRAHSQHPTGAGLGLAIVKSIVTLHGATIEVQSEIGQGTGFKVTFPAPTEPMAKMDANVSFVSGGLRGL